MLKFEQYIYKYIQIIFIKFYCDTFTNTWDIHAKKNILAAAESMYQVDYFQNWEYVYTQTNST